MNTGTRSDESINLQDIVHNSQPHVNHSKNDDHLVAYQMIQAEGHNSVKSTVADMVRELLNTNNHQVKSTRSPKRCNSQQSYFLRNKHSRNSSYANYSSNHSLSRSNQSCNSTFQDQTNLSKDSFGQESVALSWDLTSASFNSDISNNFSTSSTSWSSDVSNKFSTSSTTYNSHMSGIEGYNNRSRDSISQLYENHNSNRTSESDFLNPSNGTKNVTHPVLKIKTFGASKESDNPRNLQSDDDNDSLREVDTNSSCSNSLNNSSILLDFKYDSIVRGMTHDTTNLREVQHGIIKKDGKETVLPTMSYEGCEGTTDKIQLQQNCDETVDEVSGDSHLPLKCLSDTKGMTDANKDETEDGTQLTSCVNMPESEDINAYFEDDTFEEEVKEWSQQDTCEYNSINSDIKETEGSFDLLNTTHTNSKESKSCNLESEDSVLEHVNPSYIEPLQIPSPISKTDDLDTAVCSQSDSDSEVLQRQILIVTADDEYYSENMDNCTLASTQPYNENNLTWTQQIYDIDKGHNKCCNVDVGVDDKSTYTPASDIVQKWRQNGGSMNVLQENKYFEKLYPEDDFSQDNELTGIEYLRNASSCSNDTKIHMSVSQLKGIDNSFSKMDCLISQKETITNTELMGDVSISLPIPQVDHDLLNENDGNATPGGLFDYKSTAGDEIVTVTEEQLRKPLDKNGKTYTETDKMEEIEQLFNETFEDSFEKETVENQNRPNLFETNETPVLCKQKCFVYCTDQETPFKYKQKDQNNYQQCNLDLSMSLASNGNNLDVSLTNKDIGSKEDNSVSNENSKVESSQENGHISESFGLDRSADLFGLSQSSQSNMSGIGCDQIQNNEFKAPLPVARLNDTNRIRVVQFARRLSSVKTIQLIDLEMKVKPWVPVINIKPKSCLKKTRRVSVGLSLVPCDVISPILNQSYSNSLQHSQDLQQSQELFTNDDSVSFHKGLVLTASPINAQNGSALISSSQELFTPSPAGGNHGNSIANYSSDLEFIADSTKSCRVISRKETNVFPNQLRRLSKQFSRKRISTPIAFQNSSILLNKVRKLSMEIEIESLMCTKSDNSVIQEGSEPLFSQELNDVDVADNLDNKNEISLNTSANTSVLKPIDNVYNVPTANNLDQIKHRNLEHSWESSYMQENQSSQDLFSPELFDVSEVQTHSNLAEMNIPVHHNSNQRKHLPVKRLFMD